MSHLRTHRVLATVALLLAMGMAGCRHKVAAPPPLVSTAPPLPPSSMTQVPTVPKLPAPAEPQVGPPGSDQKAEETKPTPPRHPRRSKKHPAPADPATTAATPATTSANASAQTAAPPPAAPTLGQLSAGTGADSHERAAMAEQIHAQELRLSKIKQPLSDDDKAITEEIQAFLSKARQAVVENDLDGAQTLTTKAKVLLDELTRS